MKLNKPLTTLVLSSSLICNFALAQQSLQEDQLKIQNSSLLKIRSLSTESYNTSTIIKGRLTYSLFSKDEDMGVISASVIGKKGKVIEQQDYDLDYLDDHNKSRFRGFRFNLNTPIEEILQVKLTHVPG